jgi:proteasome beta subunit
MNFQRYNNPYEEYILDNIKKGTTTCGLTCNDGVVLTADTRATAGLFIADRHAMKIHRIDKSV